MSDPAAEAQPMSRHDLETLIVKHCWEDEAFHQEFVADPAACFVKYLNVPREHVPPITVHDEAPGTWHIVIPARPAAAGELSDEELEKVAGGTDISVTVVTMLSVAAGLSMIFAPAASMAVSVTIARGVSTGWNSK